MNREIIIVCSENHINTLQTMWAAGGTLSDKPAGT
jgi:hypothetical protein